MFERCFLGDGEADWSKKIFQLFHSGRLMMKKLASAIASFPGSESAIRRLYFRDADFRAVCEDYFDATEARRRWKDVDSRAEEYCEIIIELEHEIRTFLDRQTDPLHECNECMQKNEIENQ